MGYSSCERTDGQNSYLLDNGMVDASWVSRRREIFCTVDSSRCTYCPQVNEEDQLRIVSMEKGDNIHAIFTRFANATNAIQKILKEEGYDFMHNDHLGFILTCPSNLGTGLRAGAMVKVPLFSVRPDFKQVLGKMKLQARGTAGVDSASVGGTWDISNADRLGMWSFVAGRVCKCRVERCVEDDT